jgi:hypothetical protein
MVEKRYSKFAIVLFIITIIFFILFIPIIINYLDYLSATPSLKKGGTFFLGTLSNIFFRIPLLPGILPLVLGVLNLIALLRYKNHPELKGKVFSIIGIILSALVLVTLIIIIAIELPKFSF